MVLLFKCDRLFFFLPRLSGEHWCARRSNAHDCLSSYSQPVFTYSNRIIPTFVRHFANDVRLWLALVESSISQWLRCCWFCLFYFSRCMIQGGLSLFICQSQFKFSLGQSHAVACSFLECISQECIGHIKPIIHIHELRDHANDFSVHHQFCKIYFHLKCKIHWAALIDLICHVWQNGIYFQFFSTFSEPSHKHTSEQYQIARTHRWHFVSLFFG